jgi:hypothetical protein
MVDRHRQRLLREVTGEPSPQRPADHGARVEAARHRQRIESTFRGPDIADIPGPHLVRMRDRELAIERVCRHGQPVMGLGGGLPLLHGLGVDTVGAHQPCHTVLADPMPPLYERLPDAGTPAGLATLPVDHSDVRHERTAHEPDGIAMVVSANGSIFHRDSFAKNAAARRKKFRSWVTRANSRFTHASSSASRAGRPVWCRGPRSAGAGRSSDTTRCPESPGPEPPGLPGGRTQTHQPHRLPLKFLGYRHQVLACMLTSDFTIRPFIGVSENWGRVSFCHPPKGRRGG